MLGTDEGAAVRTKYEILLAEVDKLEKAKQNILFVLKGAGETPCLVSGTEEHIHCGTCGQRFETELDFMKHYVVPDERYYNLGHCGKLETANKALAEWQEYYQESQHQGTEVSFEDFVVYQIHAGRDV